MRMALVLVALLAGSGAALAATPAANAPAQKPAAHKELDALFKALVQAQSAEEAKPIEERIIAQFLQSGSPSIDLLMSRAGAALQGGDVKTAKRLFDSVTAIEPDFAEGWHQRARIEAVAGDDQAAMMSLEKTLALNPRQFEAYAELGSMLEDYGDKASALKMYRKAMELDPNFDGVARQVRKLTRAVEGERI